jgi:uncharacterized protein
MNLSTLMCHADRCATKLWRFPTGFPHSAGLGPYMRNRVILASAVALVIGLFSFNLSAQVIPRSIQEGGPDAALRDKKNAWTVGIVGGLLSGTYMRFVDEMASVLNDGDNLRILPIVSYGAASNLDDLLYLRGVDAAVTQSDVFEYFKTQRKTPNLERRVQYVIRLPISELHILARNDIQSLEDLRGKKVNFGPAGTGASLTGTIVFQRLGINVEQVMIDQPTALQKLQSGQVDAIARVIPKPIDFFGKIPQSSGLHLVNIPFTKTFEDLYTLGEFTKQDYPNLLQGQDRIDTIAVPAVLAVFNWPRNTDRYNRVERFRISVQPLGFPSTSAIPSEMARREFGGHRTGLDQVQRCGAAVAADAGPGAAKAATARLV